MIAKSRLFFSKIGVRSTAVHRALSSCAATTPTPISDKDVAYMERLLGKNGVITDADDLQKYNSDWTGEFKGNSRLVVRPSSTEEVAKVMEHCYAKNIPVVPQGGNTGLVGGSIPVRDELILSLSRMNRILKFDEALGAITCEAGVTLQTADEYVRERGHVMPLDLGSKGSCQVGGNLATNAGGIRLIKYGSLRGNLLGLKVVLSNGTVLDSLRTLRKDNVGYDLKQLFVGSEGTLGIITECAMLTPSMAGDSTVALFPMSTFDNALRALKCAKQVLGSSLSAYEYFDSACLDLVRLYSATKIPSIDNANFYVVVEVSSNDQEESNTKIEKLMEALESQNITKDGIVSENERQYKEIWALREGITSSLRTSGMRVFKYDVSLPVRLLHDATSYVKNQLIKDGFKRVQIFEYGHLGDGNLHFNAGYPRDNAQEVGKVQDAIEAHLYSFVKDKAGSISAEHGLGQLKAKKILYSRNPTEVEWMRHVKRTFDPKGLLNPGKILADDEQTAPVIAERCRWGKDF